MRRDACRLLAALRRSRYFQERTMASKQDFTPAEWTKLLEGAMAAGAAVSAADPSGLWGTFQEFLANSGALDSIEA